MKINASTLTARRTLELTATGVEFVSGMTAGGKRVFLFEEIDAVLRNWQTLSFQVGMETFSIPINATNAEHRTIAARLAAEAKRTVRKS